MNWFLGPIKKYAEFSGRASRQEYWMFVLFYIIFSIPVSFLDTVLGTKLMLVNLYSLALLVPYLALAARRLHDTDRSGLWLLLLFVPVLGWLALLVFYCLDSTPGTNSFGPNPKGVGA